MDGHVEERAGMKKLNGNEWYIHVYGLAFFVVDCENITHFKEK